MKKILNHLFEHKTLSQEDAKEVLTNMANGRYSDPEIAAFLTVYLMRSITIEELSGFRDALLNLCIPVDLSEFDPMDLCGTGGDEKNTFNISTLSSFVAAGAGVKVAKHGNYSVSSSCGSSNILEYFGYQFSNDESKIKKEMERAGISFLHAPLFNPAMKNVAPVRKSLRLKTFFNMLGPMVNPAFVKKQMVGVFSLELARLYGYIYQKTDKRFTIIYSLDGYDEISLTGDFKMVTNEYESILSPAKISLKQYKPEELFGGNGVEEAAVIFKNVLEGKGNPAQNDVITANAGMAINCYHPEKSVQESIALAKESLESGQALVSFSKLVNES